MFNIGDTVVHKHDICKIEGLLKNYRDEKDYYKLSVRGESGMTIYSPVENAFGLLRRPLSRRDALALVEQIPSIQTVELSKLKAAQEYKALVDSGDHSDLVRVIKTSYLRSEEKEADHKKASEIDRMYFRMAEQALYDELAVVLGLTHAEARDHVISRMAA